jgi:glyceraldehyde 3-phosphate dehydrogenase
MPIKVGINGFGRIGRNIMRTALDDKDIQFVAVNDVTDAKTLAHLLKYDSILGNLPHNVTHTEDSISVEGKAFKVFKVKDPGEIDWARNLPVYSPRARMRRSISAARSRK